MRDLRGRHAIVGVGETEYSRASGRSTRALGVEAVRLAIMDAGLAPRDIDGMLSYHSNDSTPSVAIAADLGIRLNTYADVIGGGSSTEGLVAYAMGLLEIGLCRAVVIFRAMNGYSEFRIGGTGARAATPVRGLELADRPYGMLSAGQRFAPVFMRHMFEYGTTSAQVAHVKAAHSRHAAANPKALARTPVTVEEVLASRWVVKPLHLLDCCLETDNATALVVTSADRARDGRHPPVRILAAAGRVNRERPDYFYQGRYTTVAGVHARELVFPAAGIGPEDVDVTGAYDAFTFTAMLQLEAFGFCEPGAGGHYVSSGAIELGGPAAEQHQRRTPVRGLYPRHEHGDRERAPAPGDGRRLLPAGKPGRPHVRVPARRLPPGARRPDRHEHGLGLSRHRKRPHPRVPPCLSPSSTAAWR